MCQILVFLLMIMGVRANRPTFRGKINAAPAFRAVTKEIDKFTPVEFYVGFEAAGIHGVNGSCSSCFCLVDLQARTIRDLG
jgi:hypothetical protein